MRLNELFDTPPTTATHSGLNHAKYEDKTLQFKTKNGQSVEVKLVKIDPDMYDISFEVDDSYDITGGGEVAEIFSTVLNILQNFLDAHPDDSVSFTSTEPSRTKLYNRMLKRHLKPPYTYEIGKTSLDDTLFTISRQ